MAIKHNRKKCVHIVLGVPRLKDGFSFGSMSVLDPPGEPLTGAPSILLKSLQVLHLK